MVTHVCTPAISFAATGSPIFRQLTSAPYYLRVKLDNLSAARLFSGILGTKINKRKSQRYKQNYTHNTNRQFFTHIIKI